jgi:hypothetical protein
MQSVETQLVDVQLIDMQLIDRRLRQGAVRWPPIRQSDRHRACPAPFHRRGAQSSSAGLHLQMHGVCIIRLLNIGGNWLIPMFACQAAANIQVLAISPVHRTPPAAS